MNILDQSIQSAGGVSALAKILDIEPNVVSNWRARGIPTGWETSLELMKRHGDGAFAGITNVTPMTNDVCAQAHLSR